jgi:hypothetical protein
MFQPAAASAPPASSEQRARRRAASLRHLPPPHERCSQRHQSGPRGGVEQSRGSGRRRRDGQARLTAAQGGDGCTGGDGYAGGAQGGARVGEAPGRRWWEASQALTDRKVTEAT